MSDLQEHYQLSESAYNKLMTQVTEADLIRSIQLFHGSLERPINSLGLCHYIDDNGDFNEGKAVHKYIAKAIFDSLDNHVKVEIMMYLEWYHNGDDDEDEDD